MMKLKALTIFMVGVISLQLNAQKMTQKVRFNENPVTSKERVSTMAADDSIDEVVVYGDMKIRDYRSTAPTYSLTQGSLDRLGITDISSALSRIPGITLKDYGGAGGLKTVSVRGFGAQHTAVVYDGVSLSNNQSGSIDVSRYSLDNVSDMSLVVGDNDDIFQPARNVASAASLYINTLRLPTEDLSAHVTAQVRMGSWNHINPHIRLEKNISNKFGFSLVGDYLHADNDYPYTINNVEQKVSANRKNSKMDSGNAELGLVFRPSQANTLSLKAYFYDNTRQLPGMVRYYVNDSREHKHDQNAFTQFNWKSVFSRKFQFAYVAKFNYVMNDYKDPGYPHHVKDHHYWQREYYTSASLLYTHSENLAIDYSIDYAFNNLTGGDVSTYRSPSRNTILQTIAAKYRLQRFTIVGRLIESLYYNKATFGESAKNIDHLSPSLSVSYKIFEDRDLYIRLSYKDIFRSPSFTESYYEHYGSTDLNPERTNQVNLGVTWSHAFLQASRVSLTIDAYANKVKDKIVSIPYDMFKWTNVNLGSVETKGLDITANAQHQFAPLHLLLFSGNYTYQKVRDMTGNVNRQIAYTPEHSGSVSMAWENPWANISANAVLVSSRWPNNEHYNGTMLPGYKVVGLTLYRNFSFNKRNNIHLRFDLKNIFNTQYEIVGHYPMPGRSWLFTLRYKY